MRPNFPICIFFFSLLLVGTPALLSAQTKRPPYPFQYDSEKKGSVKFALTYFRGADRATPLEPQDGRIDMAGAESGILRFTFYSNGLDFERNRHRDEYLFVARPSCPGGITRELKPVSQSDVSVKYSKDNNVEILDFEILKDGAGKLAIGFDVIKDNAPTRCSQAMTFLYTIAGMPDPAIRTCEQALAAFQANKFGAISQLNSLKNKYPSAPCRDRIEEILAQYALWKQADNVYKTDCKKAKEICSKYKTGYPNGDFAEEMDMMAKCSSAPPPPPPPVKTQPKEVSQEEKEYNSIKADDSEALIAFIDKWAATNPESRFVKNARDLIADLLPLQYEEKVLADGRRQYRLLNADRPRLKDMSLRSGLKIEADQLLSDNTFIVTPSGANEYAILVKDAKGKQATIKITNEFDATLTTLPDGGGWLLRVNGSKKPYTIYLTDDANPDDKKTWKGAMNSDTLTITPAELKKRGYDKTYRVVVKSSDRLTRPIEAGTIESVGADGGAALLDTIMFVLLLFVTLCAAYGLYLLFWYKNAAQRKATIYDRIQ